MTSLSWFVIGFVIGVTFAPLLVAFVNVKRDERRRKRREQQWATFAKSSDFGSRGAMLKRAEKQVIADANMIEKAQNKYVGPSS